MHFLLTYNHNYSFYFSVMDYQEHLIRELFVPPDQTLKLKKLVYEPSWETCKKIEQFIIHFNDRADFIVEHSIYLFVYLFFMHTLANAQTKQTSLNYKNMGASMNGEISLFFVCLFN